MWIFANNAFLSIVAHREQRGHLLVRARLKEDIHTLFPNAIVSETDNADYRFRAVVPRSQVGRVICDELMNIDYDNFKNSIKDDARHTIAMRVWSAMKDAQLSKYPSKWTFSTTSSGTAIHQKDPRWPDGVNWGWDGTKFYPLTAKAKKEVADGVYPKTGFVAKKYGEVVTETKTETKSSYTGGTIPLPMGGTSSLPQQWFTHDDDDAIVDGKRGNGRTDGGKKPKLTKSQRKALRRAERLGVQVEYDGAGYPVGTKPQSSSYLDDDLSDEERKKSDEELGDFYIGDQGEMTDEEAIEAIRAMGHGVTIIQGDHPDSDFVGD